MTGEKEANRNLYRPTLGRQAFLADQADRLLEELFEGRVAGMLEALVARGNLELEDLEELRSWLDEQILELGDYDRW